MKLFRREFASASSGVHSLSPGIKSEVVRMQCLLAKCGLVTSWFINTGLQAAGKSLEFFSNTSVKPPETKSLQKGDSNMPVGMLKS